jgi:hypothetical protein
MTETEAELGRANRERVNSGAGEPVYATVPDPVFLGEVNV